MKKMVVILMAAALALSFSLADVDYAWSYTFKDLAASYHRAGKLDEEALVLKSRLLSEADKNMKDLELWRTLWRNGISESKRAANALRLIENTFPAGDPARWDKVSGFYNPSQVPSTLAAVDAVYVASHVLVNMDTEPAYRLARNLMNSLMDSSRAKMYFIDTAPEEYRDITGKLTENGFLPDYGEWPEVNIVGSLPLASPVRGYISSNAAVGKGFVFLNASAEVKNHGYYAWDRKKGKIYKVVENERNGSKASFIFRY